MALHVLIVGKQYSIFDQYSDGSQNEGEEQIQMDVVPGAVELSARYGEHSQQTLMFATTTVSSQKGN